MDYRKLIEDYKNGTLDEAQEKQVAADIEKHEAISDYLMESAEIPGLEEISLSSGEGALSESEAERGSSDTAAQIRKLIRRAFVKAGVIVGTAVLALTLAVLFLLPRFVDCFYYDPCEIAGVTPNGIETNRMTLDMAVWSELHLPGTYRDMVMCEREGYGSIDGFTYRGTALNLLTTTGIRMYYNYTGSGTLTFTCGGQTLAPHSDSTGNYVEIGDIFAYNLDDVYTVTVSDGSGTFTWTNSPFGYGYWALSNQNGTDKRTALCYLMSSMYQYNLSAEAYFG